MKPTPLTAGLAILALVAGCGPKDQRFQQLTVGITKDSALKVMGIENPIRAEPYLQSGQYIEVLYFNPPGATDSLPDRKLSPLVVVDGKLIGWGWKSLDSVAEVTSIPVAPK